jgi:Domain of unknown function (DUF4288)
VITGLDELGLQVSSLRRLGSRRATAAVNLKAYDVTAQVRRLKPSERHAYLARRVSAWISALQRRFPHLSFQADGKGSAARRRWFELPQSLKVRAAARDLPALARSPGVRSVHVRSLAGHRRRRPPQTLDWFCVRGLVVIRIEGATSGMQTTEDRFVLVRASDPKDAEGRLVDHWLGYAEPYLNSAGELVSWKLERVVDVYSLGENSIDPAGTEVYSRLGRRRLRAEGSRTPRSRKRRKRA